MSPALFRSLDRVVPRPITVRRVSLALFALAASAALVACSDAEDAETPPPTATSAATQQATSTATGGGTPSATEPATGTATGGGGDASSGVDSSKCEAITPLVQGAFPGATLIEDVTAFEAGGGTLVGQGCRVMVIGDGDELPSFVEVDQALRAALEADGWAEDQQYLADGPTATQTVYQKGDDLAVVAAGVSPKNPGDCRSDQIISDCIASLAPDQVQVLGAVVVKTD